MRIKTFYAKTMADALQEIKASLGPDALLLSTKEIRGRSGTGRGSSGVEVVAATDSPDDHGKSSGGDGRALTAAVPPNLEEDTIGGNPADRGPLVLARAPALKKRPELAGQSAGIRKSRSKKQIAGKAADPGLPFAGTAPLNLYKDLVESGVHDWLAARLVNDAFVNLNPRQRASRPALLKFVAASAQSLISDTSNERGLPGKKIVAFIGPTGVGKTTSIAKLAAHLAFRNRKKVVLMTLDGYRIGAVEQLKTYAGLMGIPFRFVSRISDLAKAIQDHSQRDYILIDTAGRGPRERAALNELASFLHESGNIECHLVLSATTKPSDLKEIVDCFEVCKPDHLIFTKLDETTTLGPIFNELVRTRKPLSYYTDGQTVPEDLHAVSRARLVDMMLHPAGNTGSWSPFETSSLGGLPG